MKFLESIMFKFDIGLKSSTWTKLTKSNSSETPITFDLSVRNTFGVLLTYMFHLQTTRETNVRQHHKSLATRVGFTTSKLDYDLVGDAVGYSLQGVTVEGLGDWPSRRWTVDWRTLWSGMLKTYLHK